MTLKIDKKTEAELRKFLFNTLVKVDYSKFKQDKREPCHVFGKKGYDFITLKVEYNPRHVTATVNCGGRPVAYLTRNNPKTEDLDKRIRDEEFGDEEDTDFSDEKDKLKEYRTSINGAREIESYSDPKTASQNLVNGVMKPLKDFILEESKLLSNI